MLDFGFYNMDCLEGMKEIPDKFFDLAIVDPPYGGVTRGGYMENRMGGGVAKNRNDYHLSVFQCQPPDLTYFAELFRVSKNQVVWGGNYYSSFLPNSQCWIVWDKEKNEKSPFADVELAWTSFNLASRIFRYAWMGFIQGDMKNKEYKIHPTQKPVALYEWLLNRYAKDGDVILDTHVGSGSSLIACHKTRHKYIGFEIDETYYKLASERIKTETAQMSIFDYLEGMS